jgi:osmotically-inducible protein OsmY
MKKKLMAALFFGATLLPVLQGCFPVVAAGVGTGVMAVIDRRTLGAQTEDEAIEWKAAARIDDRLRGLGHFNFTSFNRKVLISGEAASEEAKDEIARIVSGIANVRHVYNELVVGPASSLAARSNDSFITSKVKSRSVDSGKFNPLQVKVVTEAGTVFLMGMVTQAEADAAARVAQTTSGVKKVVWLFEIISPEEARELDLRRTENKTTAP